MEENLAHYKNLLADIKNRIRHGQWQANLSANAEMLATYWDIGRMIDHRQKEEGWGKGVIPRLAKDLKNDLAEEKGFSERNILRMLTFYKEYPTFSISPLSVAKLEHPLNARLILENADNKIEKTSNAENELDSSKSQLIATLGWSHHIILIQMVKDLSTRYWYMQQTANNNWSRDVLANMIKNNLHLRQGVSVNNFGKTLSAPQSNLAKLLFKDPYIFDFLMMSAAFTERELEVELVKHVQELLLEMGSGFAFVGRQYKLRVREKDFYIDLLFYHLKMRCFIVVDLKQGDFLPEYAGKMNFYCSVVDDLLRHPQDEPTIGLILCQGKDSFFAEYALRDINKPIGISAYELTRLLPDKLKGSLPSVEEIENELNQL